MANRLTNLRIKRVALVDQGADQDADMVLWKRYTKEKDMPVILEALPEALRKHFEGSEQDAVDAVAAAIAEAANDEQVSALTSERDSLQAQVTELTEKLNEKTEDPMTKGMDPEVAKRFMDVNKRLEEEIEKNAIKEYSEVAKGYASIPGATPEKLGPVLYRLSKNTLTDEDREVITSLLDAANGVVREKNLLLGELGRSGSGSGAIEDPVEKIAKRFRDADPSLSPEQAYDKALSTPEGATAYEEYVNARQQVLD